MEGPWNLYCGQSNCSNLDMDPCARVQFVFVTHPSSCVNHAFIISYDVLLLAGLLVSMICKISSKRVGVWARYRRYTTLQIASAVLNGCLGLLYTGLGTWILVEKLRYNHSASPIHWWVLYFFQGFTWALVGLTTSLRGEYFPRAPLRVLSIFAFLSAGIIGFLALFAAIFDKETTVKVALDISSFLGATLLLLCTYKGYINEEDGEDNGGTLYTPLKGEANGSCKFNSAVQVSPFAEVGLFSRSTFWWLNPLMKLGKLKTLEDEDIPKLRDADRAQFCYFQFMNQLNKQNQDEPSSQSSILWTIVACHWNDILLSGIFAALKILTVSAGPLLLNTFIKVAEGKEAYNSEGYILALALFFSKTLESLSERQWYFRSRLIGLKVRSMLTAAIYKKQLRLSNAARKTHSAGEIMSYVTVDAYRIGEFPFWAHQTWTTGLQLCIALFILVHLVGLATLAALTVIILTVLCNTPLAKLQHKFQSKLMVAQDARLKAYSEALVNMKVLKLYAWETHFKNVIEGLRKMEVKWLSGVQLRRSYNGFLFWSTPILVSAATFGACYVLEIPLHANNVFTFVATLRLVQQPIRSIPDVISVVIQARVAFTRIMEFLLEPELLTQNVRRKSSVGNLDHAIVIRSANLSWETNSSKPTLRNFNLAVRPGEKVAICGEVGSGKSTLLAAILGEVPYIEGTVAVHGKIAYVSQTAWIQTGTIR